jgi:hypothetical protein
MDHVTVDGTGSEQLGELREIEEPVRVPRRRVLIRAVGDPEDAVMRLRCFLQQRRHASVLVGCATVVTSVA